MSSNKKTFIEIGACDFNNNDDLLDSGWRGVLVEPIQQYYDNLCKKVVDKDAVVVRAAITEFDGTIKMDTIVNSGDTWLRGISHINSTDTFNNTSGLVQRNLHYENEVVEVPAMTLDTLIDNVGVTEIDFLQIDVEGHELVILFNYSWKIKPKFLRIEHKFIDDKLLTSFLNDKGYKCWTERDDLYGILK